MHKEGILPWKLSPNSKGIVSHSPQHGDNETAQQMMGSRLTFLRQLSAWHELLCVKSVSSQRSRFYPPPSAVAPNLRETKIPFANPGASLAFPLLVLRNGNKKTLLHHSDIASSNLKYQATLQGNSHIGNKHENVRCDNAWQNLSICTKVTTDWCLFVNSFARVINCNKGRKPRIYKHDFVIEKSQNLCYVYASWYFQEHRFLIIVKSLSAFLSTWPQSGASSFLANYLVFFYF